MNIHKNLSYLDSQPFELKRIIAGSRLYGLDGPGSDIDLRSVFVSHSPLHLSGLLQVERFTQNDSSTDEVATELVTYFKSLRKGCIQSIEFFHADESLNQTSLWSEIFRYQKSLINANALSKSLPGYILAEYKKANVFGNFKPKNAARALHLAKIGQLFFKTGVWHNNLKEVEPEYHALLRAIKYDSEHFRANVIDSLIRHEEHALLVAIAGSRIEHRFDHEIAARLILYIQQNSKQ